VVGYDRLSHRHGKLSSATPSRAICVARRRALRFGDPAKNAGADQGGEKAQHDDHNEDLDEGEALRPGPDGDHSKLDSTLGGLLGPKCVIYRQFGSVVVEWALPSAGPEATGSR